jgi:hypothetical protein
MGSRPRKCPHCGETIPIDHGFRFDEKGNVICEKCNKIVLQIADDNKIGREELHELA